MDFHHSNIEIKAKLKSTINGLILGIILAKGGNPVIFADKIPVPQNFWECVFSPFPLEWLLCLVAILIIINIKSFGLSKLKLLPPFGYLIFIWFGWQVISSMFTIDSKLTLWTVLHFTACVICFLSGFFTQNDILKSVNGFWLGVYLAFLWVLYNGFYHHFGGLEEIRANFEKILAGLPPEQKTIFDTYEFKVKIMSNRIFSVFVYPNAFAGALLLITPILSYKIWEATKIFRFRFAGIVLFLMIVICSLSCLYWTGSKAGWLIFSIIIIFLTWGKLRIAKKLKIGTGLLILAVVSSILLFTHADYFKKGARSMGARLDYWSCAIKVAFKNPITGTGPGTFSKAYKEIKKPEYEMARLAHNDYIEQASDSGFIGFFAYTGFILSTLIYGLRRLFNDNILFFILLGLTAFSLHSLFEFHLYIPSIAWIAFWLIGVIHGNFTTINATNNSKPDS